MRIRRSWLVVSIFVLLLLGGPPALAGRGAVPIWQPTVITQPGDYIVTRDIIAPGTVIQIQSPGVNLDLNGHTLESEDPGVAVIDAVDPAPGADYHHFCACIFCCPPKVIYGGFIVGGSVGFNGGYYGYGVTKTGTAAGSSSDPAVNLVLRDLVIAGTTEAGVAVAGVGHVEALRVKILGSKVGFELDGGSPAGVPSQATARISHSSIVADVAIRCTGVTCSVTESSLTSCASAVSLVGSRGSSLMRNALLSASPSSCFNAVPDPVRLLWLQSSPGALIGENTLTGFDSGAAGDRHGIFADAGSHETLIQGNEVTDFDGNGIHLLAMRATARKNQVNGNTGAGIYVGGAQHLLEGNRLAANGGDGLYFATPDHIYRDNVLRGNARPVGGPAAGAVTDAGNNVE